MDRSYDFVGGGGRGFQSNTRRSFDNANNIESIVQQQISQQQALSPSGYHENYSSSASGSPAPPATAHQQTTSQPYAAAYYPTNPIGVPQSAGSPVSPQFALTGDNNYPFSMNFGDLSAHGAGMGGSRNSSMDLANYPVPNSRLPTGSFNQQMASLNQRPLPQFSPSQLSTTVNAPNISPPPRQAPQVHRRLQRTPPIRANRDEEPIGIVLVSKKKFKCAKSDCKELTFGRLADLRRHFEQHHSAGGEEYYCSHSGCPRGHARTGGRGRSFGARKDKRDEHERNVHNKKDSPENSQYAFSPEGSV